ncbi:MAG: substrate-binding domain-containing protein [Streptosporangiaceae bacterium]
MTLRRGSTARDGGRGTVAVSATAMAVRRGVAVAAVASVGLLAACSGAGASATGGHGNAGYGISVGAPTSGQGGGNGTGGNGTGGTGSGGTGSGGGTVSSGSAGHPGKITIALSPGTGSDPFSVAMTIGAEAEARRLGVRLVWQASSQVYSAAAQVPIAGRLLAGHPSALVLVPTDPYALQSVVHQAVHGRVPVVNVDSHVGQMARVLSFITGSNAKGGAAAATALASAMHYRRGHRYQIAVAMTAPTATAESARLAGFRARLARSYPGITIVAVAYSAGLTSLAKVDVSRWLHAYPHLAGLFAIDATDAAGAARALRARGLAGRLPLVGYDASAAEVALLRRHVFAALIAQQPAAEGRLAVAAVVRYLRSGRSATGIARTVVLPNIVLTPATPASVLARYTYPAG